MRIILKKTGETANVPESYGRRMLEMGQAKLAKPEPAGAAPGATPQGERRKKAAKVSKDEPESAD